MSEWVQIGTFALAVVLAVFNAGMYFNARDYADWRKRVDALLVPLAGLPEWKNHVDEGRHALSDRVEHVHSESKKRDVVIQEDMVASIDRSDRTYATQREMVALDARIGRVELQLQQHLASDRPHADHGSTS